MASAAIDVLPEPPAASTPSQRPSAYRRGDHSGRAARHRQHGLAAVAGRARAMSTRSAWHAHRQRRMASAAIDVLPEPPAASTPSQRPSACSRATIAAVAPRAIASTAWPRSPAARSASTSAPAAAATSSRRHVGLDQRRAHDARVDEHGADARSVQAVAQERVLAALRVERSYEYDGRVCHQLLLRVSGATVQDCCRRHAVLSCPAPGRSRSARSRPGRVRLAQQQDRARGHVRGAARRQQRRRRVADRRSTARPASAARSGAAAARRRCPRGGR